MFDALNRFISRLDTEPEQRQRNIGDDGWGFQVLRNKNPETPLEPWFDFIIGINGQPIETRDGSLFATEVRNCAGRNLQLEVWSAKGQVTRAESIFISSESPSLGVALQLAPLSLTYNIWNVVNIPSSFSPAAKAGLLPHHDYILGSPSGTLRGDSALHELVEDHIDRSLLLWVYNSEFDVVREVDLTPKRGWGGGGLLGAELASGALHRLPRPIGEEVQAPGNTLFDAKDSPESRPLVPQEQEQEQRQQQGQGLFVPADMPRPAPTSPHTATSPSAADLESSFKPTALPRHAKHKQSRTAPSDAAQPSFDDYFRESEQASKAQDYPMTSNSASPAAAVPPPPKARGESAPKKEGDSPAPKAGRGGDATDQQGSPKAETASSGNSPSAAGAAGPEPAKEQDGEEAESAKGPSPGGP